jgi:large subunit ribosomal protein L6
MSKIGKQPIQIPEGVKVEIKGNEISIEGPKGKMIRTISPEILVEKKGDELLVKFKGSRDKKKKALWGTWQRYIKNTIEGASKGFEKDLKIEGVGWRAEMKGEKLVLKVGFSHLVEILPPEGVKISVQKDIIKISGFDKEKVGSTTAKIRAVQPPEPYKGKGIRYIDEIIKKKAGKKAVAAEG